MSEKTRQRLTPGARRSQLITEATRLISELGFRRFTIAELARACGITRAGVLHHFASKEKLLLAVLAARDLNDAEAVLAEIDVDRAEVRGIFDRVVLRNASQPEIVRLYTVVAAEALDPEHPAHRYFIDRWELAVGWMGQLLEGMARPGRDIAIEIHAFMDGLQLNWLRDPAIDVAAQWAAFADAVFAEAPGRTVDLRRLREQLTTTIPMRM